MQFKNIRFLNFEMFLKNQLDVRFYNNYKIIIEILTKVLNSKNITFINEVNGMVRER